MNDPKLASRAEVETAIEMWRESREQRLAQEKIANALKEKETEYKSWLIQAFREQALEGSVAGGRVCGLSTKAVATVSNKEELMSYILETGELDLLQFRLSTSAVDERLENGVEVPGTEYIETYDLYDRKVK